MRAGAVWREKSLFMGDPVWRARCTPMAARSRPSGRRTGALGDDVCAGATIAFERGSCRGVTASTVPAYFELLKISGWAGVFQTKEIPHSPGPVVRCFRKVHVGPQRQSMPSWCYSSIEKEEPLIGSL